MSSKDKLIQAILENETIKRYKELEAYIESNEEFTNIISELKIVQKQLVNAKEFNKGQAIIVFTKQYNELLEKIDDYPLVNEYLALQSDINEVLQQIVSIIEDGIDIDMF